MGKPPIPAGVRAAIVEDIKAGTKSRNQIARDYNVSVGSVTNIAHAAGMTNAFDRSATKSATAAAVADLRVVRVQTSRRFLDECNHLLDQLHGPYVAFNFGGKDNTYEEHTFPDPPVEAKRTIMTAAAIAYDKHIAQDRHDVDDDARNDAAKSLLTALLSDVVDKHGDT